MPEIVCQKKFVMHSCHRMSAEEISFTQNQKGNENLVENFSNMRLKNYLDAAILFFNEELGSPTKCRSNKRRKDKTSNDKTSNGTQCRMTKCRMIQNAEWT
jgi:hypothetical protein